MLVSDAVGLVFTGQALTEPDGGFQFNDVPRTEEGIYALSIEYGGVFYDNTLSFQDLGDEIQLTVYEITQDATVVRVTRQLLVIAEVNKKDREISAIEIVELKNSSDRTLLPDLTRPGQMSFLRFALPLQADDLNVRSNLPGGAIVSVGTGFALTSAVLPGDHNLEFSFKFPYTGDSDFLPAEPAPGGGCVSSPGSAAAFPSRGQAATAHPIRRNRRLDVSGLGRAGDRAGARHGSGACQPAAAGVREPSAKVDHRRDILESGDPRRCWCDSGFIIAVRRSESSPRRAISRGRHQATTTLNRGLAQREALVREVASLDEEFQRGNVTEAEYYGQREALITRIRSAEPPN